MKNNLLNLRLVLLSFFLILSHTSAINSKEIKLKATEILTIEEGNIIVGKENAEAIIENEIEIYANKFTYDKKKEILIAEDNVIAVDLVKNIIITSNKINFDKKENKFFSFGKTSFDLKKKYRINSKDVSYLVDDSIISSVELTKVKDDLGNNIRLSSFVYNDISKILKGKDIELIDIEKNKYLLKEGMIRLDEYSMLGKDIKVFLRNDSFGNPENEPKLKGNSIFYNDLSKKSLIKKGIFTSCKENDNCPPWAITSKEIIHDRSKKQVNYKNAWLKIYNVPVLYFPKFFHPDPTVDRQSGFLIPRLNNSNKLGSSISIPYFNVISESSDLTFKPRIFSADEQMIQTEYRNVTKNSSHIIDVSINNDKSISKDSKTHFFSNSYIELENQFFEDNSLFVKLEKISNDNYSSIYSLEGSSPIIKDTSTLESVVEFTANKNDYYVDISAESYEKMNLPNSDRYEFVYPNYTISKLFDLNNNFFNNYEFTSSGNQKTYSTNIYEMSQINDILVQSDNFILKNSFNSNFRTLIKNVNTKGKNSSVYKDETQSEILSNFIYDISLPLKKIENRFTKLLTPKLSLRYSPNSTKNIQSLDRKLDINNIYGLNRIGVSDDVEGGVSLTLGNEFLIKDFEENDILSIDIGTVFREENNDNLPSNNTLRRSQSDFVGEIIYNPIKNLSFDYNFSLKNDLDAVNLHLIKNEFRVNNFINTFEFYEENNQLGDNSHYTNTMTYQANSNNFFSYRTRKNKKTNLTEFYNLIYEYKNDCLVASINYNKEYYTNSVLKPSENLFFNLTLIPLGSTNTDNLIKN
jgi:LPS-assembly protein